MHSIEQYQKIKYYFEDQFDHLNEYYYKKIIEDFIKENPNYASYIHSIYGNNEEIFNSLHIKCLDEKEHIDTLYQFIKKYKYQFFHTILRCIYDICNTSYEATEQFLINRYEFSPYIDSISKVNDTYTIKSILGTINFKKADKYLSDIEMNDLSKIAKDGELSEYCHDSTLLVTKSLPGSCACTMLCNQAFTGKYFHSTTLYQGQCIDLNYNCVMPFYQYQRLVKGIIIQKIYHNGIHTCIKNCKTNGSELLYLALEKQAKVYKMKK